MKPLIIRDVQCDEKILRFRTPLELPVYAEYGQKFSAHCNDFDIHATEDTIDKLIQHVRDEIRFLWMEYATEDDDKLTFSAKNLKRRLLEAIEVVQP